MESELNEQTALSWLLHAWRPRFAESLGAMIGQPVQASDSAAKEIPDDSLWWEQPLTAGTGAAVRIGAPNAAWKAFGQAALAAAGIEDAEEADVRATYLEILGQALSALATATGSLLGREVNCESGRQADTAYASALGAQFGTPAALSGTIWISASPELLEAVMGASGGLVRTAAASMGSGSENGTESVGIQTAYDLLLDVELPVSVSFGRAHIPLKEVLKLTSGSIVELNRTVTEPVEIIVNNCVIAKGEVVVVEGNYGVRIHQVISRGERLRTLY